MKKGARERLRRRRHTTQKETVATNRHQEEERAIRRSYEKFPAATVQPHHAKAGASEEATTPPWHPFLQFVLELEAADQAPAAAR